uniref:Heme-binding protein 1-like n=1 Tax=Salmo trutta TaxID=8032 RepID=A0A674BX88_SALTR
MSSVRTQTSQSNMASLSSPLRICRGILKEIRAIKGPKYKQSLTYNYVLDQFRKNQEGVSYEVRRYDGAKYASVSSEGRTFDQVTGELVRKLLVYIGGSNDQGEPIREQGLSC